MTAGGTRSLFAGIMRLVPYSGIQFFDVVVPRLVCQDLKLQFIEESFEVDGTTQQVLLPLDGPSMVAGQLAVARGAPSPPQHPINGAPVDPLKLLTIGGDEAVRRFAGSWIPLPYLRFIGRDAEQRPAFDAGPSNWVRAFVAHNTGEPHSPVQITLAFDTSLERQSRLDDTSYPAPNLDDAAFGSTFICAETVDQITPLLGDPWLETWLKKPPAIDDVAVSTTSRADFRYTHVAHYLTLLRLLAAAGVMPEARFTDTVQQRFPIRRMAVDLVLELGDTETTALLVDVASDDIDDDGSATGYADHLRLRDLSMPHVIHQGPFGTVAEFSAAPFGDAGLSRASGRLDAFAWPSLVRIGEEAKRLSLRANGAEGVTGLSNLRSFLLDDLPSSGVWRQSTEDDMAGTLGPMVTGTLLGHVGENGAVLGALPTDSGRKALTSQVPAIRPHFSRASMIGFFVSELVLHALSQINSVTYNGRDLLENTVRELRHVVVLLPASLPSQERQALLARVNSGLVMAWRGLGWDTGDVTGVPAPPDIVAGIGGDLGAQIGFLHNEVTTKYQSRFRDLLRVYRGGDSAGSAGETLRVACTDFGARATSLTIVDYAATDGALAASEWHPALHLAERLPVGTDAALQALIWTLILPAIEGHLNGAGLTAAGHFLDEITGRSATSLLIDDPYFTRRLNRKVLWPAARGLLAMSEHGAASAAYGNRTINLALLVDMGSGRLDGVAAAFDAAALQAGARGFALDAVQVELRRGDIYRIIRTEIDDGVQQICRLIASNACDLLLLAGDGSRHPGVQLAFLAGLPVPASRIVDLNAYTNQTAVDAMGRAAHGATAVMLPAIAAALERRHLLATSGFGAGALRQLGSSDSGIVPPPGQRAISAPTTRDGQTRAIPAKGA